MAELIALAVGVLLMIAALVRGGASKITWLLFRLRLGRLLTAALILLLFLVTIANLVTLE